VTLEVYNGTSCAGEPIRRVPSPVLGCERDEAGISRTVLGVRACPTDCVGYAYEYAGCTSGGESMGPLPQVGFCQGQRICQYDAQRGGVNYDECMIVSSMIEKNW